MSGPTWVYAVLFVIAAVFGLRGSIRVTRRYRAGMRDADFTWREQYVFLLLVGICWLVTAAAGWYGFLSVRTVLGFERIEGLAPVSALIAIVVLFLPTVIDAVVERVARVPWR